jgi:hypothetical protein
MSDIKPEFLSSEGYLIEGGALAFTGGGHSVFTRSYLESSLWAFGEDSAREAVRAGLDRSQVLAIGVRHCEMTYEADPASKVGNGYAGDKALALAAIEVLEGKPRGLTRKRRRPAV